MSLSKLDNDSSTYRRMHLIIQTTIIISQYKVNYLILILHKNVLEKSCQFMKRAKRILISKYLLSMNFRQ